MRQTKKDANFAEFSGTPYFQKLPSSAVGSPSGSGRCHCREMQMDGLIHCSLVARFWGIACISRCGAWHGQCFQWGVYVWNCVVFNGWFIHLPLWFQNADTSGSPIMVIFKAGDDLRQDVLTLQMIRIMSQVTANSRILCVLWLCVAVASTVQTRGGHLRHVTNEPLSYALST